MDLTEALESLKGSQQCVIAKWIETTKDGLELEAAIKQQIEAGTAIYRLFRAAKLMGLPSAPQAFNNHFTGICRCSNES